MSEDRDAKIARIRKLLQMTKANGCTEGEAIAAAEKAARLMAELGLRDGDLEFDARQAKVKAGWGSIRWRLWAQIATSTNCAPIMIGEQLEFVGRDPWPSVAAYLHVLTDRAVDRELRQFKATTWYKRRRTIRAKRVAAEDFTLAMVSRLRTKIGELFAETQSKASWDLACQERDVRHPSSSSVAPRAQRDVRYWDAAALGVGAADRTNVSHGVAGSAVPELLGGPA